MRFDNRLSQKQAKTGAGSAASQTTVDAIKAVENVRQFIQWNPDTLVRHKQHNTRRTVLIRHLLRPPADANHPTIGRILDRIAQQIGQNLTQPFFITPNQRQPFGKIHLDVVN